MRINKKYHNYFSGYKQFYQGPDAECNVDGLQPGVSYSVRVSCSNSGGCQSPPSEPAVVTTEAVCPGQCTAPRSHGRFKPTAIMLKWGIYSILFLIVN